MQLTANNFFFNRGTSRTESRHKRTVWGRVGSVSYQRRVLKATRLISWYNFYAIIEVFFLGFPCPEIKTNKHEWSKLHFKFNHGRNRFRWRHVDFDERFRHFYNAVRIRSSRVRNGLQEKWSEYHGQERGGCDLRWIVLLAFRIRIQLRN